MKHSLVLFLKTKQNTANQYSANGSSRQLQMKKMKLLVLPLWQWILPRKNKPKPLY